MIIKPRRTRCVAHVSFVSGMDEEEIIAKFYFGNLKERHHLEGLGVDGRLILKWVLEK
jgi:hypothetical protein